MSVDSHLSPFRILHIRAGSKVREASHKSGPDSVGGQVRRGAGALEDEGKGRSGDWGRGSRSAGARSNLTAALVDRLEAGEVELVRCADVYVGLARLLKGETSGPVAGSGWSGVLVRSCDLEPEEMEFFEIVSRMRNGPEVFVYRDAADGGMLESALGHGADGEISEEVVERWIGRGREAKEACRVEPRAGTKDSGQTGQSGKDERAVEPFAMGPIPSAREVAAARPATANEIPEGAASFDKSSEPERVEPADRGRHVELTALPEEAGEEEPAEAVESGEDSPRESDRQPLEPEDGHRTIRVPWKNYENRPVRRRPGGDRADAGAARPEKDRESRDGVGGRTAADSTIVEGGSGLPPTGAVNGSGGERRSSAGAGEPPRIKRREPLLTEEELRQLLGDDVAGLTPRWDGGTNEERKETP